MCQAHAGNLMEKNSPGKLAVGRDQDGKNEAGVRCCWKLTRRAERGVIRYTIPFRVYPIPNSKNIDLSYIFLQNVLVIFSHLGAQNDPLESGTSRRPIQNPSSRVSEWHLQATESQNRVFLPEDEPGGLSQKPQRGNSSEVPPTSMAGQKD